MEPAHTDDVASRYARFAEHETAHHSAVMQAWALGVAADPEVCELIETLPARERQPNLVMAAARLVEPRLVDPHQHEARPDEYEHLRRVLLDRWDEVRRVTRARHTQTNEAGRLAVVLPALHHLAQTTGRELAVIELGASAGLALHPREWRFRFVNTDRRVLGEFGPPHGHAITVTVRDHKDEPDRSEVPRVPIPVRVPPIGWRLGVDLNPLDPSRDDDAAWLRTLIWPGQTHRLERLDAAIRAARRDPVLVLRHDITDPESIEEVLRLVPRDYLPVVVNGAVLAYLTAQDRADFGERMLAKVRAGELHWISNEGQLVVPQVAEAIDERPEFKKRLRRGSFVVSLDGVPLYQADGHAGWLL